MSECEGELILTLPLAPRWVSWINIGGQIFYAIIQAVHAMLIIWVWNAWPHARGLVPPVDVWFPLLGFTFFTIIIGLLAAHSLKMHLRWGQVPKQLKITANQMSLSWLGYRRMRERHWTQAAVKSIDLKTVKDAFSRRKNFRVRIQFHRRLSATMMLTTHDPALAEQIRGRLCEWHSHKIASSQTIPVPSPGTPGQGEIN